VLVATAISGESLSSTVSSTDLNAVDLLFENQCFFLLSRSLERLAVLNEATSKVLQEFLAIQGSYFKSYIADENMDEFLNDREKTDKKFYSVIDIVLYGPPEARDRVGKLLSIARAYLQHPCYQEANTSYDNPHILKFTTLDTTPQTFQTSTPPRPNALIDSEMADADEIHLEEESPHSRVQRKVATVFDSLTRSKNLKRIERDIRIKTPLLQ
jgi:SWI/SNF-related matrix-associated actin-dependent regulator of chromatin subfamily A3